MKKDSQTIHRNHAEQKARRDKERERAGYKARGQSVGPSKPEKNPLTNPFAQFLAFTIRVHNRGVKPKQPRSYERRKT